jgi:formylglycine-generating enzyme required for sulfatase activity
MYCLACNLHYPDDLNYCKHCGRALAPAKTEAGSEGLRCTRCGARAVPGENFCQQCGARIVVKSGETAIGSCHNCGVPWRSGWLFCQYCGMARANALVTSATPPLPPSSIPTVTVDAFQGETDLAEVDASAPHCPYCAAEVMPNSRFCEACGGKLRTATTGDLYPPSPEVPSPGEPPPPPLAEELTGGERMFEAQPFSPVQAPAAASTERQSAAAISRARDVGAEQRETVQIDSVARPEASQPSYRPSNKDTKPQTRPTTVVTPLPSPTADAGAPPGEQRQRRARVVWLAVVCIGIILLLLASGLLIRQTLQKDRASLPPAPEPSAQPAPETAPTPASTASVAIEPPADMVYVPGGTFLMGRDDGDEFERPARTVTVSPFFIDRTEVTNEQYQEFINQTGRRAPPHWKNGSYPEGEGQFPVVNVSWHDAHAYAEWAGKRLPTEAEWEFAARGTDGRLYPWGAEWQPGLANTEEGGQNRLLEAGSLVAGASPYGALDMCGNVWELTASNLSSYAEEGKAIGPGKVIRGGSFNTPRENATVTYRGVVQPEKTYDKTGFRCARDIR